jgi:hypothetical protein
MPRPWHQGRQVKDGDTLRIPTANYAETNHSQRYEEQRLQQDAPDARSRGWFLGFHTTLSWVTATAARTFVQSV